MLGDLARWPFGGALWVICLAKACLNAIVGPLVVVVECRVVAPRWLLIGASTWGLTAYPPCPTGALRRSSAPPRFENCTPQRGDSPVDAELQLGLFPLARGFRLVFGGSAGRWRRCQSTRIHPVIGAQVAGCISMTELVAYQPWFWSPTKPWTRWRSWGSRLSSKSFFSESAAMHVGM